MVNPISVRLQQMNRAGSVVGTLLSAALLLPVMPGQPLGNDEHKKLGWKGAGGCVVEFANTPCRTVRYREHSFHSLGFDRISTSETIEATDQAGSESNTSTAKWRRWWQFPGTGTRFQRTGLLLRTEGRTVIVDHGHRVYEAHPGAKKNWPYWEEDDSKCSHTASHYLYLSGRLPDSTIATVHVVGYHGRDNRGADYEIYFAPSIGCQEFSSKMVTRGFLGFVTSEYTGLSSLMSLVRLLPVFTVFLPNTSKYPPFFPSDDGKQKA